MGFIETVGRTQRRGLALLVGLHSVVAGSFLGWLVWSSGTTPGLPGKLCAVCIVTIESIRTLQAAALWIFVLAARDPIPMRAQAGLRVAVLTTIVPASESPALVAGTLRAMRELRYTSPFDVWILDEGDDPRVSALAADLGVRHFTRAGIAAYNQPAGEFRRRSKAGNHNAWRAEHEANYDIVVQMDPDHVPLPGLLERTLGYFRDPDVAFVVAPQVYGNRSTGFVPQAAAAQSYLFTGTVQRGGNGLGAPLLIGTNHLYRVAAWRQIRGYQDSVTEDHLTGMTVLATHNPATGRPWKGVYTPDVLAVGLGPTTWTDYFRQQRRWAYGVAEIVLRHSRRLMPRLRPEQRLAFGLMQLFYPTAALTWLLGNIATALFLLAGTSLSNVPAAWWIGWWTASTLCWLRLFMWLRRWNLAPHERRELGLDGLALSVMSGPVYVEATLRALLRWPLRYDVTGKGEQATADRLGCFRVQLSWLGGLAVLIGVGWWQGHGGPVLYTWVAVSALACAFPPLRVMATTERRGPLHRERGLAPRSGDAAAPGVLR